MRGSFGRSDAKRAFECAQGLIRSVASVAEPVSVEARQALDRASSLLEECWTAFENSDTALAVERLRQGQAEVAAARGVLAASELLEQTASAVDLVLHRLQNPTWPVRPRGAIGDEGDCG